jgi:putative addiction module killer protein
MRMLVVRETDDYAAWFAKLKDVQARARIVARLRRVALGNLGDVGPVGDGVSEFRIHYGTGYRIYFIADGPVVIVLLGSGDKSSQRADIATAKIIAREMRESRR